MKRFLAVLAVILLIALLTVSCTNNGSEKDTEAKTVTTKEKVEVTTVEETTETPTYEVLPGGMEVATGDDGQFGPEIKPDEK